MQYILFRKTAVAKPARGVGIDFLVTQVFVAGLYISFSSPFAELLSPPMAYIFPLMTPMPGIALAIGMEDRGSQEFSVTDCDSTGLNSIRHNAVRKTRTRTRTTPLLMRYPP